MKRRLCVLLVEADAIDAKLLVRELGRGEYDLTVERVETAAAMAEALDRTAWDVVIADHCRPTFDAAAALDVVKQRGIDIPFILVSDTIGEESAPTARRARANDFLPKNRLARLRPAIERELREARARREDSRAQRSPGDSDEWYRIAAEGASDAILITDEDGVIVYVNPATPTDFRLYLRPADRSTVHRRWPDERIKPRRSRQPRQGTEADPRERAHGTRRADRPS